MFLQLSIRAMERTLETLIAAETNASTRLHAEHLEEEIDAALHTLQYKMDHCKRYDYDYVVWHMTMFVMFNELCLVFD